MAEENTTDDEQQEDPRTEFEKKTEEMAAKVGTDATKVKAVKQEVKDEELLKQGSADLATDDTMPTVDPTLMDTTDMTQYDVAGPVRTEGVGVVDSIDSASERTKQVALDAAQLPVADVNLIDVESIANQTLSDQAFAEAQTAELDKRATVQYQLSELFSGIEDGKPFPLGISTGS